MNNPYDLHSWSKRYRDEVLREVHSREIIRPTPSGGGAPSSRARATRIWLNILSLLGRTELLE
jgi:hypothetical protein